MYRMEIYIISEPATFRHNQRGSTVDSFFFFRNYSDCMWIIIQKMNRGRNCRNQGLCEKLHIICTLPAIWIRIKKNSGAQKKKEEYLVCFSDLFCRSVYCQFPHFPWESFGANLVDWASLDGLNLVIQSHIMALMKRGAQSLAWGNIIKWVMELWLQVPIKTSLKWSVSHVAAGGKKK